MTDPRDTIRRHAIPCECGCECLLVTEFDQWGDDPEQVFVEFGLVYRGSGDLRARLGIAWKVLRAKEPWLHGVALQGDTLEQMRRAFRTDLAERRVSAASPSRFPSEAEQRQDGTARP